MRKGRERIIPKGRFQRGCECGISSSCAIICSEITLEITGEFFINKKEIPKQNK
jgi:hypothetical protein